MSDEFTEICEARMLAGVKEYRQGDASMPFDGDPIECAIEETADLRNYAIHALRAQRLSAYEAGELVKHARDSFAILEHARQKPDHGVEIGPKVASHVTDHRDDWEKGPKSLDGKGSE